MLFQNPPIENSVLIECFSPVRENHTGQGGLFMNFSFRPRATSTELSIVTEKKYCHFC